MRFGEEGRHKTKITRYKLCHSKNVNISLEMYIFFVSVEADKATAIVSDIRKNGLDLAANMVRGGNTVNKISMTESGVFVIDAENEDNQVYIGASLIAITDDRWITSKTAIDKNGLISDTLLTKNFEGTVVF